MMDNPKFKEACEIMRKNIEKFGDIDFESSASEDELDASFIIEKTFKEYSGNAPEDLETSAELLRNSVTSGAVVCLICIGSIKRNDPVWSCQTCYCLLHVSCIQKWAKDSMFYYITNSEGDKDACEKKWCCPKCRKEYKKADVPFHYYCFCGKVESPTYDPWLTPHSCGQRCEKNLKPNCSHQCTLLCHPGPCPPCPSTVHTSCHCGKSQPISRRCFRKGWSCNKPCSRLLSCKQHLCPDLCHSGECNPCGKQSERSCICGNRKELRPCSEPFFKCDKICLKQLECGNHLCQVVCHSEKCDPCPKSGARPCPCQKKVMWLPCTEEVSPCGDTCDKMLECGLHQCSNRCHVGDCPNCLQMRVMKCRCGQRVKSVPCRKEYLCETKCKRKRDCGKHNCNKKCCQGDCRMCDAPCLRTLNCGTHKCQSRCHAGPCFPCGETTEVKCNCGKTKITVPCGQKSAAVSPQCNANCKLPSDCHHAERHKHLCHFGSCPPCRKKCERTLPCKVHTCPRKCHSAVLTKIEVKKKKDGPWDLADAYKMELVDRPCPLCVVPVSVQCLGGHVIHEFPCHEAKPWSCGRPCGRELSCGNHTCELQCHSVGNSCVQETENCAPCDRACEKKRFMGCTHPCHKPCHPGVCQPCKESIKLRCHCQLNVLYMQCHQWTSADKDGQETLLSCGNNCPKLMSCSHRCPQTCHPGDCPESIACRKKVTIRCKCKRLKRDFSCATVSKNQLECDEQCLEYQAELKAADEQQMEAKRRKEEEQQELELEEFRRKTEGKKKKRKKQKDAVEEPSSFNRTHAYAVAAVVALISIVYAVYIVYI